MTNRVEIYPREQDCFFAIQFTGYNFDEIEAAAKPLDVSLFIEESSVYLDGNTPEDTAELPAFSYFVVCGPYWDVLTSEELRDDFRIG